MPWEALDNARDLKRLQVIAAVLIRYGFADVLQRIGLAGVLERAGEVFGWETAEGLTGLTTPARMRRALEDLGPTFVKLGQILATRVDLFPAEWIAELGKLQDAAPAAPLAEVWAQLKEDLGDDPEAIFAEVETQPLAAASLAQVYRARLTDGTGSRKTSPAASCRSIRTTTGTRLRCPRAPCSSSDRDRPEFN